MLKPNIEMKIQILKIFDKMGPKFDLRSANVAA